MRPNPNYFHLRSCTSMTLNERFSRLNQKKPQTFAPPIRRGGIQKPRTPNLRNLRGRLNQMDQNRLSTYNNNSNNSTSPNLRGTLPNRRGLSRLGVNRGGRTWQNSTTNTTYSPTFRGSFRGRGTTNMRRGGRRPVSSAKKTPQEKKKELDADLDKYMKTD